MFSCLVAICFMPSWKFLEFEDFLEDYDKKKDSHTVGYVFNTGGHKPVLRINTRSGSTHYIKCLCLHKNKAASDQALPNQPAKKTRIQFTEEEINILTE